MATMPDIVICTCRRVFAPKLASVEALSNASAELPVAATVLFSSVAALFGAPGQANYAAANAAMEAWALTAAGQGSPSLAVQWGAWGVGAPVHNPTQSVPLDMLRYRSNHFSSAL